jgi:hypothetical protein
MSITEEGIIKISKAVKAVKSEIFTPNKSMCIQDVNRINGRHNTLNT